MYISIENFKYGVDARRSEQASQPGTLVSLNNGHVNPGGEIVKRKAFVFGSLPIGTFGLEVTDQGLTTFGSQPPNDFNPQPPFLVNDGFEVAYQQLEDPVGESLDMLEVLFSTSFAGKAVVVARYFDGTFVFYDGVAIGQFIDGIVKDGVGPQEPSFLSEELVQQIIQQLGSLGFTAVANSPSTGLTKVESPLGTPFVMSSSSTDPAHPLPVSFISNPSSGSPGLGATAAFTVTNAGGTFMVKTVSSAAPGDQLMAVVVDGVAVGSIPGTAQAIADAINSYTTTTGGFVASSSGANVVITAPVSLGSIINGETLTFVLTAAAAVDVGASPLVAIAVPNPMTFVRVSIQPGSSVFVFTPTNQVCSCFAQGGSGTYIFQWEIVSTAPAENNTAFFVVFVLSGMATQNVGFANVGVQKNSGLATSLSATIRCKVTDTSSTPLVSYTPNVVLNFPLT